MNTANFPENEIAIFYAHYIKQSCRAKITFIGYRSYITIKSIIILLYPIFIILMDDL